MGQIVGLVVIFALILNGLFIVIFPNKYRDFMFTALPLFKVIFGEKTLRTFGINKEKYTTRKIKISGIIFAVIALLFFLFCLALTIGSINQN
jgi:uncharacterized protein YjeT (DUF2065 family)